MPYIGDVLVILYLDCDIYTVTHHLPQHKLLVLWIAPTVLLILTSLRRKKALKSSSGAVVVFLAVFVSRGKLLGGTGMLNELGEVCSGFFFFFWRGESVSRQSLRGVWGSCVKSFSGSASGRGVRIRQRLWAGTSLSGKGWRLQTLDLIPAHTARQQRHSHHSLCELGPFAPFGLKRTNRKGDVDNPSHLFPFPDSQAVFSPSSNAVLKLLSILFHCFCAAGLYFCWH